MVYDPEAPGAPGCWWDVWDALQRCSNHSSWTRRPRYMASPSLGCWGSGWWCQRGWGRSTSADRRRSRPTPLWWLCWWWGPPAWGSLRASSVRWRRQCCPSWCTCVKEIHSGFVMVKMGNYKFDVFIQDCDNSSALALELPQPCIKSPNYTSGLLVVYLTSVVFVFFNSMDLKLLKQHSVVLRSCMIFKFRLLLHVLSQAFPQKSNWYILLNG